ncbi:hypothetical protein Scep_003801 [Stephania cephalantha]|uniref:Uncharacterized protein n=1 Tax=Stephania cephalantha TaxID=152367 RepID=A0AAP0KR73_9MAGN
MLSERCKSGLREMSSLVILSCSHDPGSHDRWLLDFTADLFEEEDGNDTGFSGGRSRNFNMNVYLQLWEILRGSFGESNRRTSLCASVSILIALALFSISITFFYAQFPHRFSVHWQALDWKSFGLNVKSKGAIDEDGDAVFGMGELATISAYISL